MGVVLREAAHAGQSMQLAALLVAIHGAELGQSQRQVAVGAGLGFINLAVVRAVHGFEHELLVGVGRLDGLKRILTVLFPVTRSFVEGLAADMRRHDGQVTGAELGFFQKAFQSFPQHRAFGQPKW